MPEVTRFLRERVEEKQPALSAYKGDKHAPKIAERATPHSEPQASACADTHDPANGLADLLAEKGVTVDWLWERLAAGSEA